MSLTHPNVLFIGSFDAPQLKAGFAQPARHENAHTALGWKSGVERDMSADRYYQTAIARNIETAETRLNTELYDAIVVKSDVNDSPGDYGNSVKAQPRGTKLVQELRNGEFGSRNQLTPVVYMQPDLYNGTHMNGLDKVKTVIGTTKHDHSCSELASLSVFGRVKQALENLLSEQAKEAYAGG